MKRILSLLFLVNIILSSYATNLIEEGDNAYSNNDFSKAIACYNQAIEQLGTSPELYYNLGNAYYRADSLAPAILAYNRALKLDPSFDDARYNLQFINEKYNLGESERSATTIFLDNLTNLFHPNTWALFSLILFILLLASIAGYIYLKSTKHRKIGFFSALILIPVTLSVIFLSFKSYNAATSNDSCIVMVPSAQLSTVPSQPLSSAQQAFIVPEGYRFKIIDFIETPLDKNTKGWYQVRIDDESSAWISSNDIEVI